MCSLTNLSLLGQAKCHEEGGFHDTIVDMTAVCIANIGNAAAVQDNRLWPVWQLHVCALGAGTYAMPAAILIMHLQSLQVRWHGCGLSSS